MIIANQLGNLFMNIKDINQIKVFYEYMDYKFDFNTKETFGVDPYWFIQVNNTVFAKYKHDIEKDYVLKKLKEALLLNKSYFEFPKEIDHNELMEIVV